MPFKKGQGGKAVPSADVWKAKFEHHKHRAKFKALQMAIQHLRIGIWNHKRHERKAEHDWDPMPKNAKEAAKYAEIRAGAIDQILKFCGGKTGMKESLPKEPTMEELLVMTPEERYEVLNKFKLMGLRSDHWRDKILEAVKAQESGTYGRPPGTGEQDTDASGEEAGPTG
jgi:hypothetical protein